MREAAPGPALPVLAAHASLACASALSGGWSVGAKMAAGAADPLVFSTLRSALTSVLALPCVGVPQAHAARLCVLGVVGCTIQVLFILGACWTDAHTAAALQAVSPVLGFCFPVLVGLEQPSRRRLGAGLLAACGVVLLTGPGPSAGPSYRRGVLVLLLEQVLLASYPVLQKPLVHEYGPAQLNGLGLVTSGVAALGLFLLYCLLLVCGLPPLHGEAPQLGQAFAWSLGPGLPLLLFSIFALNGLAQTLRTHANTVLPASTVVLYSATQPVWGAALAAFHLHEAVEVGAVLGTLCVMVAVGVVAMEEGRGEKRPLHAKAERLYASL